MARKKSRGKKSSPKLLPMNLIQKGIGAGLAGPAEALANNLSGGRLAGNLGAGLVGTILHVTGKKWIKQIGQGIMIKAIGDATEDITGQFLGRFNKSNGSSGSGNGQLPEAMI